MVPAWNFCLDPGNEQNSVDLANLLLDKVELKCTTYSISSVAVTGKRAASASREPDLGGMVCHNLCRKKNFPSPVRD